MPDEVTRVPRRDSRYVHWENHLESLYRDFRLAFRSLKRDRRFTIVVILTLALGIGSTTLMFSVIDCVVLHPFPYKNADRLASFNILLPEQVTLSEFPVPAFLDFKEQNHVFEDMFGISFLFVRYAGKNGTEQILGGWTTPNTFDVLGVKPLLGRQITFSDGNPNSPPVFVMSYNLWTTRFNRDPKILGTNFRLNDTPRTLVAIMPPRFQIGGCEVWLPLNLNRTTFISGFGTTPNELWAVGHLKPRVPLQTAEADLSVIAKRMETTFPTYFRPRYKLAIHTFIEGAIGRFKLTLFALMAAAMLLLLIACSNVANLLLTRATVREGEIVIRAALGATRARLMQQLLVESSVLAAVSCLVGCIFSHFGLRVAVGLIPPDTIPAEATITLNPATISFAIGVTVLTTLLCGLSPAIHSVGDGFQVRLAGSGKGTSGGLRHGGLRSGLVIAEVALSIVLLISSGLMVRTLVALERVNIGFDPAKVLYAQLSLPEGRYDTARLQKVFFRKVLDRITAIPGVVAATEATSFPPYSRGWTTVVVPGKTHAEPWGATFDMCTEGYFQTLGRQLLRGRLLSQSDVESARQVTVVNQTLAHDYFNNENPVGQRIKFSDFEMYPDWPRDAYFEIIGVIADTKNHGLQDPPRPEAYFPYTLTAAGPRGIMVKTGLNADSMLRAIRREISAADSDVVVEAGSIENVLKQSYYVGPQFTFATVGSFAVIGLLLVIVGIFSVVAYMVSLQTHDIGVRMARGARQGDILRLVLKKGLVLICTGIVIGVIASLGLTRLLASQLWGVSTSDPLTFSVVVAGIIAVGLAACFFPARKASQIDPQLHSVTNDGGRSPANRDGRCLDSIEIPYPKSDNNGMIKQVLIGPDGKLRSFWRAVIFYSLGNWGLYPLMERPLARAAQALHLSLGLAPGYTILHDLWNLAVGLICTGIFAIYEHRRVDSYGLPVNRAFSSHTFEGAAAGVVMAAVVAAGMIALGGMQIKGLATGGSALAISALAWLAANILIGIAEEFWYRHYLQQTLWKGIGFWPASIVIALVFTADHYFYKQGENVWDVITLVSLSLLMSYSILRTGTLWFAVGFHMAFDYMQLFVIGTPNGSQLPEGRLLDASFNGPAWLTGGVLGTEASFLMYPVIALLWLYVWWRYRDNAPLQPQ